MEAAFKACLETCCRKVLYSSKELLKAAACPGTHLALCPCVPVQDVAKLLGSNPARPPPPQQVSQLSEVQFPTLTSHPMWPFD